MTINGINYTEFDMDDFEKISYLRLPDSVVKIVLNVDTPYYDVRLHIGGVEYLDAFNDKEPYDRLTHIFYVDGSSLSDGARLVFTCFDSTDEDADGYCLDMAYSGVEFADEAALSAEYDSRIEVLETQKDELADGVYYSHLICKDKNGAPVHAFVIEVEPGKANLYIGTPNDGYTCKNTIATVPDMIKSANENGQRVIAAMNADFFDMYGDGSPSGLCVKNGKLIANADSRRPFIGMTRDGEFVLTDLAESPDIIERLDGAAAGLQMIVKDSRLYEWEPLEPFSFVRHPRTVAGVRRDGGLVLLEVDGRIPEYSNGATLVDLAKMMLALGADRAVNLDGGGSSIVYTRRGGEYVLHSNPADLFHPTQKLIREEFNCLLITEK